MLINIRLSLFPWWLVVYVLCSLQAEDAVLKIDGGPCYSNSRHCWDRSSSFWAASLSEVSSISWPGLGPWIGESILHFMKLFKCVTFKTLQFLGQKKGYAESFGYKKDRMFDWRSFNTTGTGLFMIQLYCHFTLKLNLHLCAVPFKKCTYSYIRTYKTHHTVRTNYTYHILSSGFRSQLADDV